MNLSFLLWQSSKSAFPCMTRSKKARLIPKTWSQWCALWVPAPPSGKSNDISKPTKSVPHMHIFQYWEGKQNILTGGLLHLNTFLSCICVQKRLVSWTSPPFWPWCTDRSNRKTLRMKSWRRFGWQTSRRKVTSRRQSSEPNSPR